MKATLPSGKLKELRSNGKSIGGCYIQVGQIKTIYMNVLPDISDSKSANYSDETAIGRSMPFKSYQSSENRTISWTAHFIVCQESDVQEILDNLRILESCLYPTTENTGGAPYAPPTICQISCGELLGHNENPLCTVMKSYSVKFDPSVNWDERTYLPHKLDVDMQFDVVYNQAELPGAERIIAGF